MPHSEAFLTMRVILSFVLGAGLALAAPALRITGGAVDDQVFQRGPGNTVDIALSGTAADADSEPIEVRITRKFIPVEGWDWKVSGSVRQDQWSAELRGVPAGGPYRIEVRVHGTTVSDSVRNVLVGDLWVTVEHAGRRRPRGCRTTA